MKHIAYFLLLSVFSFLTLTGCEEKKVPPNVIFILADDLGWVQTSAYGSDYYYTPNIDHLSEEGIKFTAAYSACPVCSPTRASIMTGKYPARLHLTDFIKGNSRDIYPLRQPEWQKFLPLEEYTLGELFRDNGYKTAIFGKWHLSPEKFGTESLPFNPDKQGFNEHFVIDKPNSKTDPEHDPHSSDSIGNRSVKFIRENSGKPFFLFASFSAIHNPLMEKRDSIEWWENVAGSNEPENNPIIAAMLSRMDRNIGKILSAVDELKLSDRTLVIFFSDNGGLESDADQTPLRNGKGWLYEGGIRVPLIVKWPGIIPEGKVSNEVVLSTDFIPTLCELLNVENSPEVDGISILSHLISGSALPERSLYWHYPHYHNSTGMIPGGAVRNGRYKLIEWYENQLLKDGNGAFELYDIENDITESVNLADSLPDITQKLADELKNWRKDMDAQMPVPNPDYRAGFVILHLPGEQQQLGSGL